MSHEWRRITYQKQITALIDWDAPCSKADDIYIEEKADFVKMIIRHEFEKHRKCSKIPKHEKAHPY